MINSIIYGSTINYDLLTLFCTSQISCLIVLRQKVSKFRGMIPKAFQLHYQYPRT